MAIKWQEIPQPVIPDLEIRDGSLILTPKGEKILNYPTAVFGFDDETNLLHVKKGGDNEPNAVPVVVKRNKKSYPLNYLYTTIDVKALEIDGDEVFEITGDGITVKVKPINHNPGDPVTPPTTPNKPNRTSNRKPKESSEKVVLDLTDEEKAKLGKKVENGTEYVTYDDAFVTNDKGVKYKASATGNQQGKIKAINALAASKRA